MIDKSLIQQAADWIRKAEQIVVLTGAGVSKESGIATFREAQEGLWSRYNPEELATPQAFAKNPKLVWDWYEYRRSLIEMSNPNPGHVALAELEKRFPTMVTITQNVDNLHELGGSKNIIHLHGNIEQNKCFANCQGHPTIIPKDQLKPPVDDGPPRCPHCGNFARPNVVWFREMLPQDELAMAFESSKKADLMLVVGTSALVTPAATLPVIAHDHGAKIIEVNPDTSGISRIADLKLRGPSGVVLPQVIAALNETPAG